MRAPVIVLIAAMGCSSAPAAPPPPPLVSLSLDSVSVDAAARELSRVTALPLVIDPAGERYAECARISVSTPTPRPAAEVIALMGAALASSGFTLAARPEGLVLSHDTWTTPTSCPLAVPERVVPNVDSSRIRAASDTEWEFLRRPGEPDISTDDLMRNARVVPHMVDGEPVGVRLYGVRRASFLGQLGFQNRDTILDVNGYPIADPETVLESYQVLRHAERYEVHLERRGERRTHVIRVVDHFTAEAAPAAAP